MLKPRQLGWQSLVIPVMLLVLLLGCQQPSQQTPASQNVRWQMPIGVSIGQEYSSFPFDQVQSYVIDSSFGFAKKKPRIIKAESIQIGFWVERWIPEIFETDTNPRIDTITVSISSNDDAPITLTTLVDLRPLDYYNKPQILKLEGTAASALGDLFQKTSDIKIGLHCGKRDPYQFKRFSIRTDIIIDWLLRGE